MIFGDYQPRPTTCAAELVDTFKPRPHQQQCQSNTVECYKLNDSFDQVECCFDIVAVFGNNDNNNGNNKISSCRQSRNKMNMFNLLRLYRKDEFSFDIVAETGNIVAKNGKNVEATFDFVERTIFCYKLVRHCCHFWQQSRMLLRQSCLLL